mmetsp:Transcript_34181/g.78910  ORF Transcript_34181/g.78910 Transcript_34181/m.78910 type:complete len:317 (-) Transcript_34181:228-1178(-)|eukprot:CAMPEP_0113301634 /NCGR_PEP_ID=MMETSP0010_2-20120614/2780_1 /TAXON_ID=216773 ORGANISM="Corethron hystrix, Strain 308" /NCGR_SAMPLE_ID=MMETSP0010_2 /ASSEMBLY_ACC=CAM_ASM_000155 /LENGTH=316 /DNA_ID=CAMNT_0000155287 /DNA_START=189 /DNA_END=1139 /DNA_ORIENTATION=+ /assembly_acc=CAM_ASM_000155
MDILISYLTGKFPYVAELMGFFMACQGALAVRAISLSRKPKPFVWFHAFALSTCVAFGGALFTPFWLGRPTSMLSSDINFPLCFIAFYLVNYSPFDVVYKILSSFPGNFVVTSFSQLFRARGVITFVNVAFKSFEASPSAYYPIPVVGPIVYATLLGNMGLFFMKGFHGHLENGMHWNIQNGLFVASFYHFYSNDILGFIGPALRSAVQIVISQIPGVKGISDEVFAALVVSIFMQIMGILQLPQFLGPQFNPFQPFTNILVVLLRMNTPPGTSTKKKVKPAEKKAVNNNNAASKTEQSNGNSGAGKKKKKKPKTS